MVPGTAEYKHPDGPRHHRRHSGFVGQKMAAVGLCTGTSSERNVSCLVVVGHAAGPQAPCYEPFPKMAISSNRGTYSTTLYYR